MKKHYEKPELNIIDFDLEDIITHSLAQSGGDNEVTVPDEWWGDWEDDWDGGRW